MVHGLISFILALIGLGILVLVHEAGHFLMAKRVGMRVEVFGIGFGRPLFSFIRKGVRFNICWIPFGGYVKIAGMEGKKGEPPYSAPDGFFAKSPGARIKVALCGPLANIFFALLAFTIIWATGGRAKPYSDVSARAGWVDPTSELYKKGVRPGDLIVSYNQRPVRGSKDHLYAAMTGGTKIAVEVEKLESPVGLPRRMTIEVSPYQHPLAVEKGILTTGILAPANFLVWTPPKDAAFHSETEQKSGIQAGDRLVWVDGESLASQMQLSALLNDGCLFVTVLRDGSYFHVRIPRIRLNELRLSPDLRGELSDWQYEAKLQASRLNQLWFLPYNLTSDGVVEGPIPLLDTEPKAKESEERALAGTPLQPGDRIVAVAGKRVSSSPEILQAFQEKHVLVIVDRVPNPKHPLSFNDADRLFRSAIQSAQLMRLEQSIGTPDQEQQDGTFVLLNPIVPKTRDELLEESGHKDEVALQRAEEERYLRSIEDPQARLQVEQSMQQRDRQLLLGLSGVQDTTVLYNPDPLTVCYSIGDEIYQTFTALFGGYLSPRWMSGPVGILQVIQQQWSVGYKEALFWLGLVSLNLAVLNLLPLPVLDGGYVLLSLFEMITGIRLKVETIEKIVLPFAVLLIGFILYLTYNDLARIFDTFFSRLNL
jgi:regulator of sigma E protease